MISFQGVKKEKREKRRRKDAVTRRSQSFFGYLKSPILRGSVLRSLMMQKFVLHYKLNFKARENSTSLEDIPNKRRLNQHSLVSMNRASFRC